MTTERDGGEWRYLRGAPAGVETAVLTAAGAPMLATHFHDETQLTLVLRGQRRFQTPDGVLEAGAGATIRIPAGLPHRALEDGGDGLSVNFYLPADAPADSGLAALVGGSSEPLSRLAERLGLSREGLIRRFARETGMTPHAYRLTLRLNRARRLLRQGEAPAIAAAESGFADQSHLSRRFRAAFGVTPGRYRAAR